jgi:hypothetical protein
MEDKPGLVHEAQTFLNSDVLKDVLKSLREEAYADIENSKPEESMVREIRYHELRALERIKAKLQSYLDNHKIAQRMKK